MLFTASWHPPSLALVPVANAAAKTHKNIRVYTADAEELEEQVETFEVENVPTVVFVKVCECSQHASPPWSLSEVVWVPYSLTPRTALLR